jgi:hypothetical protein
MVNKETLAEVAENLMIGQALIYDYAYEHSTRSVLLLTCHDDSVELSLTKMHGNAYDVPDNELYVPVGFSNEAVCWTGDEDEDEEVAEIAISNWVNQNKGLIADELLDFINTYYDDSALVY